MAAQENSSEQQLESGKDVLFHPHSSTFFSKGLCLILWKNMIFYRKVSIGRKTVTNLRFADNIDALAKRARTRGPS